MVVEFKKGETYVAVADYTPKEKKAKEIPFVRHDKLVAVKQVDEKGDWWMMKNPRIKKEGLVPTVLLALEGAMELNDWCHGAISRNGAEYLLNQMAKEGAFLVRESQSQPGQYTLDLFSEGKVIHYRIQNTEDGRFFFRTGKEFDTIRALIEHHMSQSDGLNCKLEHIVPRAHAKTVVFSKKIDDEWEINKKDVVLGKRLGGGNFGEVFLAKIGDDTVAVKTIKEESMETVEFMKEAHVMKKFNHPNLVRLIGVCTKDLPLYIVTEYVENGDLLSYLRRPESRSEIDYIGQLYIASQIADGMSALEAQKTLHRDLAARNCLVGEKLVVKICDFGMGRVVDEDLYTARTGTKMPIKWTAPEALCYDAFSSKSDVWSYGIVLWEIVTYGREQPYDNVETKDLVATLESGYRMPKPPNCSDALYKAMMACWEMDPKDRPTFASLRDRMERLHAVERGEMHPDPEDKPSASGKSWRQSYQEHERKRMEAIPSDEADEAPAETSDKKKGPLSLDSLISLTKSIFGKTQHMFRYCDDANCKELVGDCTKECEQLEKGLKKVPVDKAVLKNFSAAFSTLKKSKMKAEIVRPNSEKLRDAIRDLNKALKDLA